MFRYFSPAAHGQSDFGTSRPSQAHAYWVMNSKKVGVRSKSVHKIWPINLLLVWLLRWMSFCTKYPRLNLLYPERIASTLVNKLQVSNCSAIAVPLNISFLDKYFQNPPEKPSSQRLMSQICNYQLSFCKFSAFSANSKTVKIVNFPPFWKVSPKNRKISRWHSLILMVFEHF